MVIDALIGCTRVTRLTRTALLEVMREAETAARPAPHRGSQSDRIVIYRRTTVVSATWRRQNVVGQACGALALSVRTWSPSKGIYRDAIHSEKELVWSICL